MKKLPLDLAKKAIENILKKIDRCVIQTDSSSATERVITFRLEQAVFHIKRKDGSLVNDTLTLSVTSEDGERYSVYPHEGLSEIMVAFTGATDQFQPMLKRIFNALTTKAIDTKKIFGNGFFD